MLDLQINSNKKQFIPLQAIDKEHHGHDFKALFSHCKLKRKGPPNQFFINQVEPPTPPTDKGSISDDKWLQVNNAERDEEYEGGAGGTNAINSTDGPSACGNWEWSECLTDFPIDAREAFQKIIQHSNMSIHSISDIGLCLTSLTNSSHGPS